jgi:hypothetical protein
MKNWISFIPFCVLLLTQDGYAQVTKRVLFLGNSYTSVNNLPAMTQACALSAGDSLIIDSNTPGGYTFEGHSTNAISLQKIALGNWDFVVLQEQSQRPSFPIEQVEVEVFPYAAQLDALIQQANACKETIFYMTWGRANGDASNCPNWPPVCTYAGMDSLLNERYRMMANDNDALLAPVGAVWRYLREQHPEIQLYQTDESHPSEAGPYAAACTFYSVIYRKNPTLINYIGNVNTDQAAAIRNAVEMVVYNAFAEWHVGEYDPQAAFTADTTNASYVVSFLNQSTAASDFLWNFGDGNDSEEENPTHTFAAGIYTVELTASRCGLNDTVSMEINVVATANKEISDTFLHIYPNPVRGNVNVEVLSSHLGHEHLEIVSAGGILCARYPVSERRSIISLHLLSEGLYFLRLMRDNELIITEPMIVKSAQ